ncbi:hypothetical protein HOU02_gp159 [Caulobacter phage CcrBL9]|uniref:Uncharacterized protein n=1 Tax=Caulobacter phage CcrBL9 TaxID=2283270 RepID=A0A385EBM5_9CAUD|nr:hypothetical protein HOU02_gp026 [Caulobacter phage CcrBL9]YP_009810196.1 hypothetical protein HOU02_gp159 [Caulobacter phage CcrBL9]AXQ69050.1 hypothetical protein CcrBL9_gp026 [Caulobacter phage CcrBL9]AXQ69566.1 hypothetical protein CcrBL9_gp542 [Caulobacter phage CcrBL9]
MTRTKGKSRVPQRLLIASRPTLVAGPSPATRRHWWDLLDSAGHPRDLEALLVVTIDQDAAETVVAVLPLAAADYSEEAVKADALVAAHTRPRSPGKRDALNAYVLHVNDPHAEHQP